MNANFTCSNELGVHPQYTDYYIEVPVNNNGYEPPILLARRTLSTNSLLDQFTGQVGFIGHVSIIVRKLMFCPSYHTHTTLQTPVMKWCWRLPILRMEPMGPHILLLEASVPALPLRTSNIDEKMVQTRGL